MGSSDPGVPRAVSCEPRCYNDGFVDQQVRTLLAKHLLKQVVTVEFYGLFLVRV